MDSQESRPPVPPHGGQDGSQTGGQTEGRATNHGVGHGVHQHGGRSGGGVGVGMGGIGRGVRGGRTGRHAAERTEPDDDTGIVEHLQRSLLPSVLEVKGLVTAAEYLPAAQDHNVGGDWYDVFEPAPGHVAWVVGDVAGHGFNEAVVMAQLRNALRAYALETFDPASILLRLDRFLAAYLPNDTTATACVLVLDRVTHTVRYSVAGHPPPLLLTERDGRYLADWLDDAVGWPLGVRETDSRPVAERPLHPGDTLVLYTDGLIEKPGEDIDAGMDRLRLKAQLLFRESPPELCRQLMRLPGEEYAGDDRALLVSRIS